MLTTRSEVRLLAPHAGSPLLTRKLHFRLGLKLGPLHLAAPDELCEVTVAFLIPFPVASVTRPLTSTTAAVGIWSCFVSTADSILLSGSYVYVCVATNRQRYIPKRNGAYSHLLCKRSSQPTPLAFFQCESLILIGFPYRDSWENCPPLKLNA